MGAFIRGCRSKVSSTSLPRLLMPERGMADLSIAPRERAAHQGIPRSGHNGVTKVAGARATRPARPWGGSHKDREAWIVEAPSLDTSEGQVVWGIEETQERFTPSWNLRTTLRRRPSGLGGAGMSGWDEFPTHKGHFTPLKNHPQATKPNPPHTWLLKSTIWASHFIPVRKSRPTVRFDESFPSGGRPTKNRD
jgi:hypothetical protein